MEAFVQLGQFGLIFNALCPKLSFPCFIYSIFFKQLFNFIFLFLRFFSDFSLKWTIFFLFLDQINVISRHNKSFSKETEKVFLRKTKLDYLNHQSSEPRSQHFVDRGQKQNFLVTHILLFYFLSHDTYKSWEKNTKKKDSFPTICFHQRKID